MAGNAGAVYKEKSKIKIKSMKGFLLIVQEVSIDGLESWLLSNRNSLSYIPVYGLEG